MIELVGSWAPGREELKWGRGTSGLSSGAQGLLSPLLSGGLTVTYLEP